MAKLTCHFLTLTVLPRRPPQKGLMILEIDRTALWVAILILKRQSRSRTGSLCLHDFFCLIDLIGYEVLICHDLKQLVFIYYIFVYLFD